MKKIFLILSLLISVYGFGQNLPNTVSNVSGTDTYTTSISNYGTSYSSKVSFVKFTNTNTTTATINIAPTGGSAIGAVPLRMWNGSAWATLTAGQIKTDRTYQISYDNSGSYFRMIDGVTASTIGAADVTFAPTGNISATNVQAMGAELDTEKQPTDSDLTTIAGLSPSNDDFLQRKSGAWANRTVAQVKTDLGLTGTNSGDQTATTVPNTPAGNIAATDVAAAITELDGEKVAKSEIGLNTTAANVSILSASNKGLQFGANGNVFSSIDIDGNQVFTTSDTDTGSPTAFIFSPGSRTNNTASTSAPDFIFNSYRPVQYAAGAFNTDLTTVFYPKVISATGTTTIKTAATVTIAGGPVADNNITIQNAPSLHSMDSYGEFEASGSSVADRNIVSSRYSSDNGSPRFIFKKSRGSRYSPSAVTTGDFVGGITTASYDGTAYYYLNPIAFVVNGTVSTSSVPVDIIFQGNGIVEQARMLTNGKWGFKTATPLSTIDVVGSIGKAVATVTTNTTLTDTYYLVLVDATTGSITITLPTATSANRREYIVKKIDSSVNTVVVDGSGSETIDGTTTQTITTQYGFIKFNSSGNAWYITGN